MCVSRIELAHFEFARQYDTHPFFLFISQHSYSVATDASSSFTKGDYPNIKCTMMSQHSSIFHVLLHFLASLQTNETKSTFVKNEILLNHLFAFLHFSRSFPQRETTYYLFGKIIFYSISNSGINFILDGKGTTRKYCSVGMVCGAYLNCFLRE